MESVEIQRIQGLIVLASCLPPAGRCQDVVIKALALDHQPPLSRLSTPPTFGGPHAYQQWVESMWGRLDLSREESEVVWWQNTHENMEVAIEEIRAIQNRMGGRWPLH